MGPYHIYHESTLHSVSPSDCNYMSRCLDPSVLTTAAIMKTRQTLFMITVIALLGATFTEAASRHTDVDGSVSLSRRLLQINPMPLSQAAGVIHPLRHLLQRAQPTRPSRPANPKASDTASSRWKVMEKWSKKAAAVAKERAFVPNP